MKRRDTQAALLPSLIMAVVLVSQISPVIGNSNFQWGLKQANYHYHTRMHSVYFPPTETIEHEIEADVYASITQVPELPTDIEHWSDATYIQSHSGIFYTNSSEASGFFEFRAVLIGNWSELTRLYNLSFQAPHLQGTNSTFIETELIWGYILHQDFIVGQTYWHYEVHFSKTDGVMNYYLEDSKMALGITLNKTIEYTRTNSEQEIITTIVLLGGATSIAIVTIVYMFRRKERS